MFVTFEGCEGVGKTTQIAAVEKYLTDNHIEFIHVREPGGTHISEQIRNVILDPNNKEMNGITEAYLYASSRAQLVNEKIKPALKEGKLVICDRFVDSSVAYQGYARGLGADLVRQINAAAVGDCMPDLTVFLDLSPAEKWRKFEVANDRLEQESVDFHNRVYAGFKSEIPLSNGRIVPVKPQQDRKETTRLILEEFKKHNII